MFNKNMKFQRLLPLLLLLILIPNISAFDWSTHKYIARQVLGDECELQVDSGSIYPDQTLKDTVNHHCYRNCPINLTEYCPTKITCPALAKARDWILEAPANGCERYFNLAVATHYLSDSMNVMHQLSGESGSCHSKFEEAVGKAVEKNPNNFTVEVNCTEPPTTFYFDSNDLKRVVATVAIINNNIEWEQKLAEAFQAYNVTDEITNETEPSIATSPTPQPSLKSIAIPTISPTPDWKGLSVLILIFAGVCLLFAIIYFATKNED